MRLNVNTSVGSLRVRLEKTHLSDRVSGLYFTTDELAKIQNFERYIFGELLSIKKWYMQPTTVGSSAMIIVPLVNSKPIKQ